MTTLRMGSLLLTVMVWSGCDAETGSLDVPTPEARPQREASIAVTGGSGDLAPWVGPGLAALERGDYQCSLLGGPLHSGAVVEERFVTVAVISDDLLIRVLRRDGDVIRSSASRGPRAGAITMTTATADQPLAGADTLLRPLFDAAVAADCPRT